MLVRSIPTRPAHTNILTLSETLQANCVPNKQDIPFQQRLLVVNFEPLVTDGHIDYSEWSVWRELLSSLTPDFDSMLVDGRIDANAIRDCTAYLEGVIGLKRDRSANMWGSLLAYMLNLNYMFQCEARNAETIAWVAQHVCSAALDRCHSLSVLERFLLAVHSVRIESGCSPLGFESRTIHWHCIRENGMPTGSLFPQHISLRVETLINIIKGRDV